MKYTIEVLLKDKRNNLIAINVGIEIPATFTYPDEVLEQVKSSLSRYQGKRWHAEDTRIVPAGEGA